MNVRRVGLILLFALLMASAIYLSVSHTGYADQDRDTLFASSSTVHPAGTDELGRDRLIRVAAALLLGLAGAIIASALTTIAAAAVGSLAAFAPTMVAYGIILLCDLFLALPWLFLLMMVRSVLSLNTSPAHSAAVTFLVLAALGWPACASAVYKGGRRLRESEWMMQARAEGLRPSQLIRHLWPNLLPLLVPQFLVCVPAFVIAEANLGAMGLGIGEPLPSWGGMLLELQNSALLMRSLWVYFPIVLLMATLLLLECVTQEKQEA